jgi:hypothetical protein
MNDYTTDLKGIKTLRLYGQLLKDNPDKHPLEMLLMAKELIADREKLAEIEGSHEWRGI